MARRFACALGISLVLAIVTAPPAAAGGPTWLDFDSRFEVVGEVAVSDRTDVWFPTAHDAQAALATTYYVYLAPGYRYRDDWRPPGRDAVLAGRIALSRLKLAGNILRARSKFVVPDLSSGKYSAYACDLGCTVPLGDVYPAPVRIFQSEMEARLVGRLERVRDRMRSEIFRLDERFQNRLTDSRVSILRQAGVRDRWTEEKLREEIGALNARIDRLVKAQQPTWSDYSLRLALVLISLIAVAYAWTRRRAKPAPLQSIGGDVEEGEPVVQISARAR
jgi:hypothetical protein